MTKVQVEFEFDKPLAGDQLGEISIAHGVYGIARLTLSPAMDKAVVDYDASRLTLAQVESELRRMGLPIRPVS